MRRAAARLLPDGRRLHLQDGPIDLVIEAVGVGAAAAYRAAIARFESLLDELCLELGELRRPASLTPRAFTSPVAQRMERAVAPLARVFLTPMAAVAGAVADEILAHMLEAARPDLRRAHVNNGGDIALWLGDGETTQLGLVSRPDDPGLFARAKIAEGDGIGGVATSGAPGRSFSLGIADAVTILAATAAEADAAATIVANAIDLPGDSRVSRAPARSLQPDSDLGERLVTRAVAPLDAASIERALASGAEAASALLEAGRIRAAALHLQRRTRIVFNGDSAPMLESARPNPGKIARLPIPSPLVGEGKGGGRFGLDVAQQSIAATPLPGPPPQGGREIAARLRLFDETTRIRMEEPAHA